MRRIGQAATRTCGTLHNAVTGRVGGRGHGARRTIGAVVVAVAALAAACTTQPTVPITEGPTVVRPPEPDLVGPIRAVGDQLVDGSGRTVLVHGLNSVAKSAPFLSALTPEAIGDATFDRLAADGFNGIRLGVWPAAVMPAPGVVDEGYVQRVRNVVDELAERGLWVILDFHQDVFWGMPEWATLPEAAALSPDAPSGLDIGWAAAYAAPRSTRQWDDWWANAPAAPGLGVVDAYAVGVAAVAAAHADAPNVIGVELINEPYPGSDLIACGLSDCPALDEATTTNNRIITDAVRQRAPEMPVWWTPQALFPMYSDTSMQGPGPADGSVGLSFHTYCLYTDGGEPTSPPPAASALCEGAFAQGFNRAVNLARHWGTPAMLTEFGASASPLNATIAARLADEHLLSWFHWASGRYPDVVESQIIRTSAQATAGSPLQQRFDPATGDYLLRFRPDPTVTLPTSIVVPGRVYPAGYEVSVVAGSVTSAPDAGRVLVVADPGATEVAVRITRR
jgi:endoglycosylceramidase